VAQYFRRSLKITSKSMRDAKITLRDVILYVMITSVFFCLWIGFSSAFYERRSFSPSLLLNALTFGIIFYIIRINIAGNFFGAIVLSFFVMPFILLTNFSTFFRDACSIFSSFPDGWLVAVLSFLWLPPLVSILIVAKIKR
jgi:hypothetical protein